MEDLVQWFTGLVIWQYRSLIIRGLTVSIHVTIISMIASLIIGLFIAFLRLGRSRITDALATAYIEIGRNTPILVTLLWTTYVLPPLLGIRIPNYWTAVIALVLQTSGYLAETFRSGIEAVDKGQTIASQALGMDYFLMMRRIILPQAFRKSVPDVINNIVVLFKTSTLVSIVAVPDLMYQASRLVSQLFKPVEVYSSVALIYIVIVFVLSAFTRKIQLRFQMRERGETVATVKVPRI